MIPLVSGMLSSLVMGGIKSLLGGGGQAAGGVMPMQTSMTGMPLGRAPMLPGLANYPRYADGGMMGGIAGLPPVPPGETPQMAYAMDKGGMIRGPGGGVDDLISGSIDNRNKVLLSDGEFVVPARVVSALGDGSSEAGAKVLHGMLERVKAEADDRLKDNGNINLNKVLPA